MQSDKDEYFMKALKEGYRARSAYKLLQLGRCFNIFKDAKNVIDLCAAPGSWSQVISNQLHDLRNNTESNKIQLRSDVNIVAVDLAPIRSIPGVTSLVADITDVKTCEKLRDLFKNEKVDVIVCDGAHDVSGVVLADFQLHIGLITACMHIILQTLKENGSFVAKLFDTWGCQIFINQLKIFFKEVHVVKPHSSRSESYECFAVCKKYTKLKDFDPSQLTPYLNYSHRDFSCLTGIHKFYIPFLVLGHYEIEQNEFNELHREYGDELYEKIGLTEEIFMKNELSDIKKSLKLEEENVPHDEKFVDKVLNKYKFSFGLAKSPFVIYLNKDDTVDFHKTIDVDVSKDEISESDTKEQLSSEDTDDDFVVNLFEGLSLEENEQISSNSLGETHPWFKERKLEDNEHLYEEFDIENILNKTEEDVMKILRENNGSLPDAVDLTEQFSLLENPNGEVLKLVKERRDIVEDIQTIVESNLVKF